QLGSEFLVLFIGKPAARNIVDDRFANPRHVIGHRGAKRGADNVDRPVRKALLQHLHDRMAAHEVADPDVRHQQNRPLVAKLAHAFTPGMFLRTKSSKFPPLNRSGVMPAPRAACMSLSLSPMRKLFSFTTGQNFIRSSIMPQPGFRQSETRLKCGIVPSGWNGQCRQSSICAPAFLNSALI